MSAVDAVLEADVVIVGSGSSGGVVAARLSEDPDRRVVVLEAGPDFPLEHEETPPWYPAGSLAAERGAGSWPPDPALDWGHLSEPLPNGRRMPLPRGRLVGGTSMANTSVAVRPKPSDLDLWAGAGATGWRWDRLKHWFGVVEKELSVTTYPRSSWLPVQELVTSGYEELGFRFADDLLADDAWGGVVGAWPRSRRNELRLGTLNTYLRAARGRANLTIAADCPVDKVLVERGRACGVGYLDPAGRYRTIRASEVVISAGAYGSAPILLRSGIGPAEELAELGVEVVADLPVGTHLMEHPALAFRFAVDEPYAALGWPALAAVVRGDGWWGIPMPWDEEERVAQINYCLAWTDGPDGRVTIRDTDPRSAPVIDHGFSALLDQGAFDEVAASFEALLATEALRAAGARSARPREVREWIWESLSTSAHPAGGCDLGSVLDPQFRVRGVEGLRVVDASSFPRHVTNNPNLLCFVLGEMAAQLIDGQEALA